MTIAETIQIQSMNELSLFRIRYVQDSYKRFYFHQSFHFVFCVMPAEKYK